MKIRIDNKELKEIKDRLTAINKLIDEVNLKFKKDGMHIRQEDLPLVCVVDYHIPKEKFLVYEYDEDRKIGIDLRNLTEILKSVKKESIEIEIREDDIKITLISEYNRTFIINIIEVKDELPDIDNLKFETEAEISLKMIKRVIKEAKKLNDWLDFETTNNKLKISNYKYDIKYNVEIDIKGTKPAKSRYAIDYLEKIFSVKSEIAVLNFNTDYPLMVSYGDLKFILAPRVDRDK